jgi:2-keto-4-pentenoate hydratase
LLDTDSLNTDSLDTALVASVAERLRAASASGVACAPVRDQLGLTDLRTAYAVQQLNLAALESAGQRPVGRKIGLTSTAVQTQLGVDQPDFGTLLDEMQVNNGGTVGAGQLLQPKVEAEVAFVLGADLDEDITSTDQLLPAIESVVASIEIVDSRIANWDIKITDTIADNASSGMFVLGSRTPLGDLDLVGVEMSMTVNGEVRSTGAGADCMGNPLIALMWLARTARELGNPLRKGDVVLSGALGPMVAVIPGDKVHATISGLGSVEVSFARALQDPA